MVAETKGLSATLLQCLYIQAYMVYTHKKLGTNWVRYIGQALRIQAHIPKWWQTVLLTVPHQTVDAHLLASRVPQQEKYKRKFAHITPTNGP